MNQGAGKQQDAFLKRITDFYLESGDWNGLPLRLLLEEGASSERVRAECMHLIRENLISIEFGDRHPNPHVKALEPDPASDQLAKLARMDPALLCAYPTPHHLATIVDRTAYHDRPFTLRLALGEPSLRFQPFDLSVLEGYRNDPRYVFSHDDVQGYISASDAHHETMPERDSVLLETFGFAFDENLNRAVASYLTYLGRLSPEHQQTWYAKRLDGKYFLHPDYARSTAGEWPIGISVFDALLLEQKTINEMCSTIGKPPLFRPPIERPRELGFLLRPTEKDFLDSVHTLDKLLSDKLKKDFFRGDVELETEIPRKDGKVEVRQKGTLALLEEWVRKTFRTKDPKPIEKLFATLREIRKKRQPAAHAINDNTFDQKYVKEQRELAVASYDAVRTIRLMLANHPGLRAFEVDEQIRSGKNIWSY